MNFKDMIVPFILSVATVWAVQHFFFSPKSTAQQYEFSAPQSQLECAPLSKTISFAESKRKAAQIIPIETSWGSLEFSTDAASLSRLLFKRAMNHDTRVIGTIFPPDSAEQEHRAFIVALHEQTPYQFQLIGERDTGSTIELTFEGSSEVATVRKTFVIYKELRQMDLQLSVKPHKDQNIQPRIFYPAPFMPELKEHQQIAGDVMYGADTFKKEYRDSIKSDLYWVKPSLFGVENKYFVHALVQDAHGFTQRAYYKLVGDKQLQAIIEGPSVDKEKSWNLSFYLGPKESAAMKPVDEKLENTLDYSGIWAPISRVLLMLLNWINTFVHNYGWAIIILTVLMKLLLMPFSLRAKQSMKDRAEMQKRLQYIQQKYKDDPQAKAQAQAEFMRKHGLGLGGCLPMLLQIPIFLGLSRVLSSSIELYQAPFLWMNDLSTPDPYYILPICVLIGILYSAFNSADSKQRLPLIAMAIVFGAVSATLPAGLVLYIAIGAALNLVTGF